MGKITYHGCFSTRFMHPQSVNIVKPTTCESKKSLMLLRIVADLYSIRNETQRLRMNNDID